AGNRTPERNERLCQMDKTLCRGGLFVFLYQRSAVADCSRADCLFRSV
ncbi:MAG: hypothetical protein AVDCRST_MAG74-1483, partial [uncultured Pyrinomonadaceae bacterium]